MVTRPAASPDNRLAAEPALGNSAWGSPALTSPSARDPAENVLKFSLVMFNKQQAITATVMVPQRDHFLLCLHFPIHNPILFYSCEEPSEPQMKDAITVKKYYMDIIWLMELFLTIICQDAG
ncbi:hypothetical protein AV530_010777 [Patagioenas fasciata monilis]|uniref:Uncharacterized protein n=1 Tax=Patagioenas fasciata monilis TaxID=372326 RepID=A0A1V4K7V5_PATFA|nr:hypothetical protein AV530_010777 [Patagioenas fasciata monilis]